ncbi:MAG: hypothetical protein DMG76_24555 [Acidobacteria bacterium]|nr:MAG: hypothetical protein DMG76_24555 [Acidobacteriota bacterium]
MASAAENAKIATASEQAENRQPEAAQRTRSGHRKEEAIPALATSQNCQDGGENAESPDASEQAWNRRRGFSRHRRLGIGLDYLYSLLWTGKLQGRKVGKRWRVPSEAVESRLKERE